MHERKFNDHQALQEVIQELHSPAFLTKLNNRNLAPAYKQEAIALSNSSEHVLIERADYLLEQATKAVKQYKRPGDFLIPYSGGRDSTLITYLLRNTFPDSIVNTITVLTGFSEYGDGIKTPGDHIKEILHPFGLNGQSPNFQHFYLDLSKAMQENVILTAEEDRDVLGYPAICSTCKILMEIGIAEVAERLNAPNIPYGYVKYQAMQQWPEQTDGYRETINEYLSTQFPNLNVGSPLWEVLEFPCDPLLLMGKLGIPLSKQKGEIQCAAGGLNPTQIDEKRLLDFMRDKLEKLPPMLMGDLITQNPMLAISLVAEAHALKENTSYTQNIYHEN